jgi:fibro-slime domain-containing protein
MSLQKFSISALAASIAVGCSGPSENPIRVGEASVGATGGTKSPTDDRSAGPRSPGSSDSVGTFYVPTEADGACSAEGGVSETGSCGATCADGSADTSLGRACGDRGVECGDGALGGIEQCDAPNVGQGCSSDCRLEPGYVCSPPISPPKPNEPAACHETVCGDATQEGTEVCDDGNDIDADGCSSTCSLEPDCSSGTCASQCGDAMRLSPEECDDGNTTDGDGCSLDCRVETGFTCTESISSPPPTLNLAVTYRDFIGIPSGAGIRHPDFETFVGEDVTPDLVRPTLDVDGKPVLDGRCTQAGVTAQCPYGQQVTSVANFEEWYRDVVGVNLPISSTLLLARQADGSYSFDSGNTGLYPIDDAGWTVTTPPMESTGLASAAVNDGLRHDFGFTTEVRYFFQYNGGASLTFSGDDDLWIFINRRLALDLGGLHRPIQRTIDIDQNETALGLTLGGLYEIAIFHAERHSDGSNFKLNLTGFTPTSSSCQSACGDAVRAANEECDDGNRVGGDGCASDCQLETIIR